MFLNEVSNFDEDLKREKQEEKILRAKLRSLGLGSPKTILFDLGKNMREMLGLVYDSKEKHQKAVQQFKKLSVKVDPTYWRGEGIAIYADIAYKLLKLPFLKVESKNSTQRDKLTEGRLYEQVLAGVKSKESLNEGVAFDLAQLEKRFKQRAETKALEDFADEKWAAFGEHDVNTFQALEDASAKDAKALLNFGKRLLKK